LSSPHVNSNFTVTLDTTLDLSLATLVEIIYRKPGSSTDVVLPAVVLDQTKVSGEITFGLNDTEGKWLFRPHTVIAGEHRYGDAEFINVVGLWAPVL